MRRRVSVVLLASLGVLGALAPSASGAANPDNASCVALLATSIEPGTKGQVVSTWAKDFQPLGEVVREGAQAKAPDCPPPLP